MLTAPTGTVGQFFFEVLHSVGGVGYGIWQLKRGDLPPGLHLDASGALIGVPTEAGRTRSRCRSFVGNTVTMTVTIHPVP